MTGEKKIKFESETSEFLECSCGNTVNRDGFVPVDSKGNETEPNLGGYWDGSMRCESCGVIENPFPAN